MNGIFVSYSVDHVRCSSVTSNVESFDLFSPSSCPSSSAAAASGDVSLHWLQQVRSSTWFVFSLVTPSISSTSTRFELISSL